VTFLVGMKITYSTCEECVLYIYLQRDPVKTEKYLYCFLYDMAYW